MKDWLVYLKDNVGYEGWRFDFVKGYGPEFVKEYVLDTVGEGTFNVGEYWVDLRCAPQPDSKASQRPCCSEAMSTRRRGYSARPRRCCGYKIAEACGRITCLGRAFKNDPIVNSGQGTEE